MHEKRKFSRMPVRTDVRYRRAPNEGSELLMASSRDLSAGGIGVVLQEKHSVGTMLEVLFHVPGSGQMMAAHGRIARLDEFIVGPDKAFDAGIEFTDLDEMSIRRLNAELVAQRF